MFLGTVFQRQKDKMICYASAGNRTPVESMATIHHTTGPLMLCMRHYFVFNITCIQNFTFRIRFVTLCLIKRRFDRCQGACQCHFSMEVGVSCYTALPLRSCRHSTQRSETLRLIAPTRGSHRSHRAKERVFMRPPRCHMTPGDRRPVSESTRSNPAQYRQKLKLRNLDLTWPDQSQADGCTNLTVVFV